MTTSAFNKSTVDFTWLRMSMSMSVKCRARSVVRTLARDIQILQTDSSQNNVYSERWTCTKDGLLARYWMESGMAETWHGFNFWTDRKAITNCSKYCTPHFFQIQRHWKCCPTEATSQGRHTKARRSPWAIHNSNDTGEPVSVLTLDMPGYIRCYRCDGVW